jgi:hypothetical protein
MLNGTTPKDNKPLIMPGNVRAIQVVSLVDEIDELGTGVRLTKLVENSDSDGEVLISVLSAAEMLGLIRNENGSLFLTEQGLKLKEVDMARVSTVLKEKVAPMEPFRTAIELASKTGSTTAKEVAETLSARGIEWHYKPELNALLIRNLLIHWGIRASLLNYDGKDEEFSLVI